MEIERSLSVFGLGYVGIVTGACLADEGHRVIGVDVNSKKVALINKGKSPIIEKGIGEIVSRTVRQKRFSATGLARRAVLNSDISIICVGTPSAENGAINVQHLKGVCKEIGGALRDIKRYHTIIIRSTVLPGTTENIIIPILEKTSSKKAFKDFGVLVNPEFMREGNSIEDFYNPAKVIVGSSQKKDEGIMRSIYRFIDAPFISTDIKTAEFSKYLDNIFHGLKIAFANEIGTVSNKFGVDGKKAMQILCMDKKSNISGMYLKPGFAFGGSCIPKDIKAVLYNTRMKSLDLPLVESILKSNTLCIQRTFEEIMKTQKRRVAMLGLSFKPATDDLRDSQMVRLAELLIGKGIRLKIYDRNVSLAKLTGTNKAYIEKEIPHISSLLCKSLDEALKGAEVIVIGHNIKEFKDIARKLRRKIIIDLTV